MARLTGKVAIVTGAGRGVGKATALLLAREGAHVVVNDLDVDEAAATVNEIILSGHSALVCAGSVTDPLFPDQLMQAALNAYGQIDILINNAGYIWNGAMHNHSDEQWQAMLDIHVTAPFKILKSFSTWLRQQAKKEIAETGRAVCRKIVNAAVIGLTKTLAKEWGRYNVTVNCVAFGHIDTRLTQPYTEEPPSIRVDDKDLKVGLSEAMVQSVTQMAPLGRVGQPEDGAGAIYLFCIPESDFITGEVLTCSGGA